jgi:hypothetical protein
MLANQNALGLHSEVTTINLTRSLDGTAKARRRARRRLQGQHDGSPEAAQLQLTTQ